jgi:hypothetical protein
LRQRFRPGDANQIIDCVNQFPSRARKQATSRTPR